MQQSYLKDTHTITNTVTTSVKEPTQELNDYENGKKARLGTVGLYLLGSKTKKDSLLNVMDTNVLNVV
tara:strand:+ start:802 stop:1005 length:204 start_codon:yes stop_codon:yes gene_type:complete